MKFPKQVSGATLIESLIAIVILSIGFLSIGLLQLQSKHLNLQAIHRSVASQLAHEVIERMRNNNTALSNYLSTVGGQTISSEPNPDCSSSQPCLRQQLAAHDLWQWEQMLDGASETSGGQNRGGLFLPTACITGPAGGGAGTYTVSIAWRGSNVSNDVSANTCGQASGNYDDVPGDNVYRRLLSIDIFIDGV